MSVSTSSAATIATVRPGWVQLLFGVAFHFYPGALILAACSSVVWFVLQPGPVPLVLLALVLYVLPPLTYRLHNRIFPLTEGRTKTNGRSYLPWWGTFQIQYLYLAAPFLEAALRAIPGLYSAWLRLWGSKIGRGVVWTPNVEILDRGLLTVGDRVVFGHRATLGSHVFSPGSSGLTVAIRRISIGEGAFIGACARLGPGVIVERGAIVGFGEQPRVFSVVKAGR